MTGFIKSEVLLPAMADLDRMKKGTTRMNTEHQHLRSEGVTALFFTTLSCATTIAIALLPFVTVH